MKDDEIPTQNGRMIETQMPVYDKIIGKVLMLTFSTFFLSLLFYVYFLDFFTHFSFC